MTVTLLTSSVPQIHRESLTVKDTIDEAVLDEDMLRSWKHILIQRVNETSFAYDYARQ